MGSQNHRTCPGFKVQAPIYIGAEHDPGAKSEKSKNSTHPLNLKMYPLGQHKADSKTPHT